MTGFLSDLVHAARRLAASPGFTAATLVSIGLGVGVNVAVFTVANELLIKPLAVPRSGELVRVYRGHHSPLAGLALARVQSASSFTHVFGELGAGASFVVGAGEPERVRVNLASDNLFQGLEVVPVAGRLFTTAPGAGEVVLSHEFWLRRFGGDPAVVGQPVRLNDRPFTVVGVAPPGRSSSQVGWWSDVIVPTRESRAIVGVPVDSIQGSFYVTARLAPGATLAQANTELGVLAAQLAQSDSSWRTLALRARPAQGVTEELRLPATTGLAFLGVIALLVLVMAATNVGNLMLARNAARRRELGVRTALGASRARLLRLLLAEAGVLAAGAGALAWLLASWGVAILPQVIPAEAEVRLGFTADWRVLVAATGASVMAILLFGLVPARVALARSVSEGIKEGGAIGHGVDGARVRRRFLMVQVALCALLLATGSLFVRSLSRASAIPLGFQPAGVITAAFDLEGRGLTNDAQQAWFARFLALVREVPGVEVATWSRIPELTGSNSERTFLLDGAVDTTRARGTYTNSVGPSYHETLRIPLLAGRDFTDRDVAGAPLVAIVNETFAAREWPGEDPLGRRVSLGGTQGPWFEVVGVSQNVKYHTLGEGPKAFLTLPVAQDGGATLTLEARVAPGADVRTVSAALERAARSFDPRQPPPRMQPLTELQKVALLPARIGAVLLGGIGALAFVLAAVGVGGVAAYTVAQRRREIGVRVALGATGFAIVRGVLQDTGRTVARGAAVGMLLALGAGKLIASQLYGVSFADPLTFVSVPILLLLLALGAAALPAQRALRVPPTEALRAD